MLETWNREELYAEVWEQPLVKIAPKYAISVVMLGKICRQLLIPVPGRGYWAKKQYGKPVRRLPLPEGKNLPSYIDRQLLLHHESKRFRSRRQRMPSTLESWRWNPAL